MQTLMVNNKHYQECDVVLLPTKDDSARIIKSEDRDYLVFVDKWSGKHIANHLYILSNDEIKEGDWYYNERLNQVFQAIRNSGYNTVDKEFKIIATTDSSLFDIISNGEPNPNDTTQILLPQLPQSFIEYFIIEYNKGNVITKVLVEVEDDYSSVPENEEDIILPWRAYVTSKIKLNQNNEISILTEQKQVFSREEVVDLINKYSLSFGTEIRAFMEEGVLRIDKHSHNSWIQQNLK
jgi:hypothetical protein